MNKRFVLSMMCLLSITSFAYQKINKNVSIDNISYCLVIYRDLDGGEWPERAYVISNTQGSYSGNVSIPESVNYELDKCIYYETDEGNHGIKYEKYMATFVVDGILSTAFADCKDLLSIRIPKTVYEIVYNTSSYLPNPLKTNPNPLKGCVSLVSIIVEEGNTYFSSDGCNAIIESFDNTLIAGCKNTVIPESVKKIGRSAFYNIKGLESMNIPSNVNTIYGEAFVGCSGLKSLTINSNTPPDINETYSFYPYPYSGDNGDSKPAFDESVKYVTLRVKDVAIEYYKGKKPWSDFKEIVPIEKVTDYNLTYYVDGDEYKTAQYKYDDAITPEPYPVKEGYTFSGWKDLPTNMPGKDIKIYGTFVKNEIKEGSVVYWAKNENAEVVGNEDATGEVDILASVEFNQNELPVTVIDDNAFKNCAGIIKVNIPATITKIGERAFANIDKLTDVTILAEDIPETDRTAFENSYIEDYVTLHVPAGSVEKYKAVAPWKNFKEVVAIEGTKVIPAPEIVMENGEVTFTCEEEGVDFHYEVTPLGQDAGKGNKITLGQSYRIKVYASKDGYQDSEVVTKEITIKKGDLNLDGKVDVADHVELSSIIMTAKTEEESSQEDQ